MEITDFPTDRYSYEVRYARTLFMWDRAGAMTQALARDLPDVEVADGAPSRVSLLIRPNVELVFEHEKAFVLIHRPKRDAADLMAYAKAITKAVLDVFEVTTFTRVGTRFTYERRFDSLTQATERLMSFKMLRIPDGRVFNQQGTPKQCDYFYRWEGDTTGVLVRFATVTEKLEFTPPPQHADQLQPVSLLTHRLVVDIDYFSTAIVAKEQLRVEEWIKKVFIW